jgi:hypothetical protein
LYLPVQDSINWETAKITDGAPPIQYKEDWDSNLIYTPYVEYKIKTTDDNIYSGDKLISIKLSLDASSIKTSSARQHNTGNNVITVDSSLSSADFNVRVSENDEQVNKVYATSYQGREGEWVTIRFRRIGDITQYAGINVQASGFTYPNSPATTIANLYPYENYSSGWHGDWSLDQGNSISGNRVLVFAPGESEVAFQILLRSDNYPEKTERLSFNVEDLGNLYSNRTYNGKHLQKITIEGSTYVDILDASSTHSLSPSSTSINEGSTLTTTVSTTNVTPGTALYYSLSGTGITSADFSSGSLTGSGTVSSSGSFSFSHTLANDLTTEGTESLEIKLYSDSSRSTQVASTSVSINDTSLTPTSNVTVNGNNNGIANAGTINNNGTINTGTINTNSGNTTNNTTNTTVNNTNITYNYYTNTTNNVNSNNTTNNVNSNNTLNTWNIFRVRAY